MAKFRTAAEPGTWQGEGRRFPFLRNKYSYTIDKNGRKVLQKNGATNFYEQIQEGLHDNDVEMIIKRVSRGDMSALGQVSPVEGFIDTLSLPRNLMEAENTRVRIENLFSSLPQEERDKYGQDVYRFIKDVNTKIDERMIKAREEQRAALMQKEASEKEVTDNAQ